MPDNSRHNPVGTYLQEADDLLADVDAGALSLRANPNDGETINRLFRAFHTIKGSGAMFGFVAVASFTHHVETLLDQVREGLVPVSSALSNLILAAGDHIKVLLQAAQGGAPADERSQAALLREIEQLSASSQGAPATQAEAGMGASQQAPAGWNIEFRPPLQLLMQGANPLLLFRDLKKLGPCVIEGHVDQVPELADLKPGACYLWWTVQLAAPASREEIRDVFLFVEDDSELRIEPAPSGLAVSCPAVSSPAPAAGALTPEPPAALVIQAPVKEATVRVPTTRLDRLVNLVGELVMNHSRLATAASRFASAELAAPVEEIERLVSELRDDVLQIRMMPIGSILGRFQRLVHDLSQQLGKEIQLVTEGEETELDKSILDQLGEPLLHLLRNSIDHGIEDAETRAAQGKPKRGTIRMIALHRGSDVVVSIEDDGKGLDKAAIRAKAIAKELITPEMVLTDKEIFNLVLLPGFSTAQAVTSISGRGVGMDVVRRQIDALRGTLNIASEAGRGSCISLTLPLTLAIIEGLLVEAGDSQYIVPMPMVTENVELPLSERERNNGRNVIAVRGELVPYIDLRPLFGMPGSSPGISKIVLVRHEDQRIGLVVDRVMGTHQTVIQTLGPFFSKIDVVSGSTIMGDGRVALILDVPGVVRLANQRAQFAGHSRVAA